MAKGESKDGILTQELIEIDGMHQRAPCVGGLGGMLGQIIFCFHAIHKYWGNEIQILDPKLIQNFLYLYIETKMKTEKMVV